MATQQLRVRGVQETLRDLRQLQPAVYKETMRNIRKAAKPLQAEAQGRTPTGPPLSGFDHQGRTGWSKRNARVSVNTGGRRSRGMWTLVKIRMNGAAGALFDMAGRGGSGSSPQGAALVDNLNARYRAASRAMWPAAEAKLDLVQRNVSDAIGDAERAMNTQLRREWI